MVTSKRNKKNLNRNKKCSNTKSRRKSSPRSSRRYRTRAYARSQFWDKLESSAKNIGEGAYAAARSAGSAIAKGTVVAGKYVAKAVKDDMAFHRAKQKKRSMQIAFARRNGLKIDPNHDDLYYTRNGEAVVVDVMNANEVSSFENEYRGHIRGGNVGYGYGYGSPRQVIILR